LDGNAKQGGSWWGAAGVIDLYKEGIPAITQDGEAGPIAQSVQLFMCYGECDDDAETIKCSMDENNELICPIVRREFGFIKIGYCAEFGMWQLNEGECARAAEYYANVEHLPNSNYNLFESNLKFDESSVDPEAKSLGCAFNRGSQTAYMRYEPIDREQQQGEFCKTRKAYMWFNEEVNQATAKERCSRIPNGQLATFSSELEYMEIVRAIKNDIGSDMYRMLSPQKHAWIGLEDVTGNEDWQFINGDHHNEYCEEYGGCLNLPMWNHQDHLNDDYDENCAVVFSMSLYQYAEGDDFQVIKGMNDFPCDALRTYVCEIFDPQIFYAGSRGTKLSAESGLFGAKAVSTSSDDSPDSASPQSNSASSSSDEGANFIDFDPSSNMNSTTASAISVANKNLLILCLVVFNIGTILGCISCLFWSKQSRMGNGKVIYDGVHDFDEEEAQLQN